MLSKKQLEERKKYIGASEAAGVLGLSRYANQTPLFIWSVKTGQIDAPQEESLPMWVGTESEEMVAKRFTLETSKKVHKVSDIIYHPKYPFLACHIDRKVEGEDTILQCKTASAFKYAEWDNDIPKEYIIQEFHELACTGYKKAIIACLIGNSKFVMKEIIFEEHKKTIEDMIKKEVYFWENYVLTKTMPVQITAKDNEIIYQMFPIATEEEPIKLSDEADRIADLIKANQADLMNLKDIISRNQNELKIMLKENACGETGKYRILWKNVHKNKYEVAEQNYRQLTIKEKNK